MIIRYTIECQNCGYRNFMFPIDPEDFHYCPECNSRKVKTFDRTEIDDDDSSRVH